MSRLCQNPVKSDIKAERGCLPVLSEGDEAMKKSQYLSHDELPLFLNAKMVAKVLGVSSSSGYELMHEPGFPILRIGNRMVVPKEKFIQWVKQNTSRGIS